jgi:hypothetical protein
MVEHFRVFDAVTGNKDWLRVMDTCYRVISVLQESESEDTGLVPDFAAGLDGDPVPVKARYLASPYDGAFYYNACRVPFRLGVDYVLNGDRRAEASLRKLNTWIAGKTGGVPSEIRAGYTLDGEVIDADDRSMAFTACLAVGAMSDPSRQEWLNALWESVAASKPGVDGYYGDTLKMLCMIVLSGNWWTPMPDDGPK